MNTTSKTTANIARTQRKRRPASVADTRPVAVYAENLRRESLRIGSAASKPRPWRRAGMPRKVWDVGALPFARLTVGAEGKRITLLVGGSNTLYCRVDRRATDADMQQPDDAAGVTYIKGTPERVCVLPARPLLATASAGVIRLMLEHHADYYLTYDRTADITSHGEMPEVPEVVLKAASFTTIHQAVETVALSGTSSGASGSQLSTADCLTVRNAIAEAYRAACRRARERGFCAQPVMARWRALDSGGNTVAVGPTVALCDPAGFSATNNITMTSTDAMKTLGGGTVQVNAFAPGAVAPAELPEPWNRLIDRLIVEVTEEIDPFNAAGQLPHGVHSDPASGATTVTARLPGTSIGTVTDTGGLRDLAVKGLSRPLLPVKEFAMPFGGGMGPEGSTTVFSAVAPEGEAAAVDTTETIAASRRSYSCGVEADGLTVLCNPLEQTFAGWSPECFITSRESAATEGEWRLAFSVTLRDGTTVLRETRGTGAAPATINPVLSYPAEEAVKLTVSYKSPGGECYRHTFALTPPARGTAAYVAPALIRHTLVSTEDKVDDYSPAGEAQGARLLPGTVDIYAGDDLGRRLDRRSLSRMPIHAVRQSPRSSNGWDFSRRRLLFFGEEGTLIATINARGQFHSVAPVDIRPVFNAEAVGDGTDSCGARLLVIAGGDLIAVAGQKTATLLAGCTLPGQGAMPSAESPDMSRIAGVGWCNRYGEVWLLDAAGALWRRTVDDELVRANLPGITRTMSTPLRLGLEDGDLLLSSEQGTWNLSDESRADTLPVVLRERYNACGRVECVRLSMLGSALSGTVSLMGDRGTEVPERMMAVQVNGAVNSPVAIGCHVPYRPWIELHYSLAASPDLRIDCPTLTGQTSNDIIYGNQL